VTDVECDRFERRHPDLASELRQWRAANPGATAEKAVRDLGLWHNPRDGMAQRYVWWAPKKLGDPLAMQGFHAVGGKLR